MRNDEETPSDQDQPDGRGPLNDGMFVAQVALALGLVAFALAYLISLRSVPAVDQRFPVVVLIMLAALAAAHLVALLIRGNREVPAALSDLSGAARRAVATQRKTVLVVGVALVYTPTISIVGLIPSTAAVFACTMVIAGLRRPVYTAIVSLAFSLVSALAFVRLLDFRLPLWPTIWG